LALSAGFVLLASTLVTSDALAQSRPVTAPPSSATKAPVADARQINVAQAPIAALQAPQGALRADVWLDRPDGLYMPRERLKLYVRVNQDAYITVVNVNARGEVLVLFPNQYATSNKLKANTVLNLPGNNAAYQLEMSEPYGGNLVKVIASTSADSPIGRDGVVREGGFDSVKRAPSEVARQINVVVAQKPQALWAMSQVVLAVVPQRDGAVNLGGQPPAVTNDPGAQPAPPLPAPPGPASWALPALSTAFGVELRSGAEKYVAGAPMSVRVTPEKGCTMSLIGFDPTGKPSVLYPNATVKKSKLPAGKTTFLPSSESRERLVASGAPGVHTLVAVCSEDEGFFGGMFKSGSGDRAAVEVVTPTNVDALLTGKGKVGRASATYIVTGP